MLKCLRSRRFDGDGFTPAPNQAVVQVVFRSIVPFRTLPSFPFCVKRAIKFSTHKLGVSMRFKEKLPRPPGSDVGQSHFFKVQSSFGSQREVIP